MMARIAAFLADESGATAIEYAMIAGLVTVVAMGAMSAIGASLSRRFVGVTNALS